MLVHIVAERLVRFRQVSVLRIESLVDADGTLVSPLALVYAMLLMLDVNSGDVLGQDDSVSRIAAHIELGVGDTGRRGQIVEDVGLRRDEIMRGSDRSEGNGDGGVEVNYLGASRRRSVGSATSCAAGDRLVVEVIVHQL